MISLTAEQSKLLEGTRAADGRGRPLVLHHGTLHAFDRFSRTKDIGFHFGSLDQARCRLLDLTPQERRAPGAGSPRIVSVALAARNPLVLPDDPGSWEPQYLASTLHRFLEANEIEDILGESRSYLNRRRDRATVRRALVRAGYDSVVYRNEVEIQRGRKRLEWSWLALAPGVVVTLGESLVSRTATFADKADRAPGVDPDAEAVRLGGVRNNSRDIACSGQVAAFREGAQAVIRDVLCTSDLAVEPGRNVDETYARSEDGSVTVRTVLLPDSGRARLYLEAPGLDGDAFAGMLRHLAGPMRLEVGGHLMRPTQAYHESSWHPGEEMRESLSRYRGMLASVVEACRDMVPEPMAPRF